jgi:hypothetical protein
MPLSALSLTIRFSTPSDPAQDWVKPDRIIRHMKEMASAIDSMNEERRQLAAAKQHEHDHHEHEHEQLIRIHSPSPTAKGAVTDNNKDSSVQLESKSPSAAAAAASAATAPGRKSFRPVVIGYLFNPRKLKVFEDDGWFNSAYREDIHFVHVDISKPLEQQVSLA